MSGILSLRPSARFCVLCSMNWYFLDSLVSRSSFMGGQYGCQVQRVNVRDHLGKALQCLLDICAGRHIVFDSLDEGCIGNAPGVGCGVLAVSSLALFSF
jgi:hypothetical protein